MKRFWAMGFIFLTSFALGNPAHKQLTQLSESRRSEVLAQFLRASGEACDRVTRSWHKGMTRDSKALWDVACANGHSYAVIFYPDADGSSRVLDCKAQKALTGIECFR
jgi:hypothetical protein